MKRSLYFLFIFITLVGQAQKGREVILGSEDRIYSSLLHEERSFWVHLPNEEPDPDGNIFAKKRYPVVYLLDGWEPNFSVVSSLIEQLSGGSGNLAFPKLIVIGIPNTDRTRDLTPTHAFMPMMDSSEAARSGGGEKFISFLEQELMPHIDSLYPTAPFRILIGHSLGGLMAVYSLASHPSLFQAYIAIDPSTIWDEKLALKMIQSAVENNRFKNNFVFLAIANTMNSGIDTTVVGFHMRTNFQLKDCLAGYQGNGLVSSTKYYPDYDHGSVPPVAEYDGLRSIFSFYSYNFPFGDFFSPDYHSDSLLSLHYKKISEKMGYKIPPPEQFVNAIAHELTGMKLYDRAYYYFKSNIENYPASFNAYQEMGYFFESRGDRKRALEFYKQALSMHDSPELRKKVIEAGKN